MNDLYNQLWFSASYDEKNIKSEIGAFSTDVPLSFQGVYWSAVTLPHIECTREIANAIESKLDEHTW